jgi:hypothetical protein
MVSKVLCSRLIVFYVCKQNINNKSNVSSKQKIIKNTKALLNALFAWLIRHQPAVLFSQSKPATATSQQYFSLRTNQHQPSATSQTNMLRSI